MKLIQLIIIAAMLIAAPSCTLSATQQSLAVALANTAITKLDKKKQISVDDRAVIVAGIRAATSPKDRTTASLIAKASTVINSLVDRGIISQDDADSIDSLLALGGISATVTT